MGRNHAPLQATRHGMLHRLGFAVYMLDDEAQIETILKFTGGYAG